jgi:hypothetical protein
MKRVTGMKNDRNERKRRSEKEEKCQVQVWSPNTQTRPWSRDLPYSYRFILFGEIRIKNMDALEINI